ncbi:sensor histidine kinase [Microbacterium sp. ZW T5_56]|uniref:sensor histidine kinase n=1 Tax=Microbacterium sp. ZW T5_56 TaxID=3378081 RepID=UPI0038549944
MSVVIGMLRVLFTRLHVERSEMLDTDLNIWAAGAFMRALSRVLLVGCAVLAFTVAPLASIRLGGAGYAFAVAEVALGLLMLIALVSPIPPAPIAILAFGLGALILPRAPELSALASATTWQLNFASFMMGALVLSALAVPVTLATTLICALMIAASPHGEDPRFTISLALVQVLIVTVTRLALASLLEYVNSTDRSITESELEREEAALQRHTITQMSEQIRILHDTAINTLGAIANGNSGVSDMGQVRAQCARDVTLLRQLRGERLSLPDDDILDIFRQPGLQVTRTGLDDDELRAATEQLPAAVTRALLGCVREAQTNAMKHSGADEMEISTSVVGPALRIALRDTGHGFDVAAVLQASVVESWGSGPHARKTTGFVSSIHERARANGFDARVTSVLGTGTTVLLTVPLRFEADDAGTTTHHGFRGVGATSRRVATHRAAASLISRAGMFWAVGATLGSAILLIAGSTNLHLAQFPMIGFMVLALVIVWRTPAGTAPATTTIWLTLCMCAVFLLSGAASGFGSQGWTQWNAIAATAPYVLLLAHGVAPRYLAVAGATAALCIAAAVAAVAPVSANGARVTLTAGIITLAVGGMWSAIQVQILRLNGRAAAARDALFQARMTTELASGAQRIHGRWVDAGLDNAVRLLSAIANGEIAADDPASREACVVEERYLRQLSQIGPDLIHLGPELVPTLLYARSRGIDYTLRVTSADAKDDAAARRISTHIIEGLQATSPGQRFTASIFPTQDGLQLTMVHATEQEQHPIGVTELVYAGSDPTPLVR